MIDELADDHASLIEAAIACVHALSRHALPDRFAAGPLAIEPPGKFEPVAENGVHLSAEMIAIARRAVVDAAAAPSLAAALDIGYRAFGESACTAAAREGIGAFLQRRPADFSKTG
jgi:enoyl-CoA hydratase/3-hydroxyacyl-CoA dehydrogenase